MLEYLQAKSSIYDGVLEESLLEKMNKEGMLLPLRHLLDDPALPVVRGAVKVLESLFVNDVDEVMLFFLLAFVSVSAFHRLKFLLQSTDTI